MLVRDKSVRWPLGIADFSGIFGGLENTLPWHLTGDLAGLLPEQLARLDDSYQIQNGE